MSEESSRPRIDWRLVQDDDPSVSGEPDKYTKKSFVEGGAPGQVFKLNWLGIEYGTDDKVHSAAVMLSVFLLMLIGLVVGVGAFSDRSWIPTALQILGPAFTFVAGVAVGKSIGNNE